MTFEDIGAHTICGHYLCVSDIYTVALSVVAMDAFDFKSKLA
jgi:hypothetical protein